MPRLLIDHGMICTGMLHSLKWNQVGSVIIKNESVVQEDLKQSLISTCKIEYTLRGHNVAGSLWEWEGIVN
jgi:hypothetical protein